MLAQTKMDIGIVTGKAKKGIKNRKKKKAH